MQLTPFGTTMNGQDVGQITLDNGTLRISVLTYGAILQSVHMNGVDHNLTLGTQSLADYEDKMQYYGTVIGPIVNRIAGAKVEIDGLEHRLEANQDRRHSLHSGSRGLHKQVWDIADYSDHSVTLKLRLGDGVCGLPGNREFAVIYQIEDATLTMTIKAISDEQTVMNIAHHGYWNLNGHGPFEGHSMQVAADAMLPTTDEGIPTGEIAPVDGTMFDLRQETRLVPDTHHFDHNWVLSDRRQTLRDVAWLRGQSGVSMTVSTTECGLQIYDGRDTDNHGFVNKAALAIEPQSWPDAPNHRSFPSIDLGAGEPYLQVSRYTFAKED